VLLRVYRFTLEEKTDTTKAKCGGLSTTAAKAPPLVEMTILLK
jgi:hypothetical protein